MRTTSYKSLSLSFFLHTADRSLVDKKHTEASNLPVLDVPTCTVLNADTLGELSHLVPDFFRLSRRRSLTNGGVAKTARIEQLFRIVQVFLFLT